MTQRAIAAEVEVDFTTVQKWTSDIPVQHRLADVNPELRTGTCALCGRVKLRKNGQSWRCHNAVVADAARTVTRAQERLYAYLKGRMCADCGESECMVLEFDHVRGTKAFAVCDMVRKGYAWKRIEDEIAKCDLVCANCHRIRTNQRGGWYRHELSA